MKKINYILFAILSIAIWSCDDDDHSVDVFASETLEINAVMDAPALTDFVITETTDNVTGNEDEVATEFSWNPGKGIYNGQVLYYLQLDLKGNNFKNATYIPLDGQGTTEVTQQVTFGDLNQAVNKINADRVKEGAANPIDFSIQNEFEIRIMSAAEVSGNSEFSDAETITITAYEKIIVIEPKLFIVGSVQGYYGASNWTPAEGVTMRYIGDGTTKLFEAYVKASATDILKFISNQADWDKVVGNYGDDGTKTGVLINSGDSGNIEFAESGLYYVQVDIDNLTYKTVKMQWGIIGNATAGGWSDETDMTYDLSTNTWEIEANLDAGELKFRSKNTGAEISGNDWAFNCGPDYVAYDLSGSPNFQMPAGIATITMSVGITGDVTTTGVFE